MDHHQPKITTITPSKSTSLIADIVEVWRYRELFISLSLRDIKARYKQSFLGILWIVVQPVATCIVFTVVFGHFVKINSGDIPYPVFVFSGLLLWQFFSRNLAEGVSSLVTNAGFINKVFFPRIGIPLIGLLSSAVDFVLALILLFALMLWFNVDFHFKILSVPLVVISTLALSYSGALIFSPLNAVFRDVGMMVGYGVQFLMYLSPVIYPVAFLPEEYRWLFDFNPIATLLDWMRWAVIGSELPSARAFVVLFVVTCVSFMIGRLIFRKLEPTIVDRI